MAVLFLYLNILYLRGTKLILMLKIGKNYEKCFDLRYGLISGLIIT